MEQGASKKGLIALLIITPLIVLPFVLLLMRKKTFTTQISASSLKKEGTALEPEASVLAGIPSRLSWFSGQNATEIILFQDGSVVVTQGQGTLIAGTKVSYWWGFKNWIWKNISSRWNKSLGVGPQNQANVSLKQYQYQVTNWVFIGNGSVLGNNLSDPYEVRASVQAVQ